MKLKLYHHLGLTIVLIFIFSGFMSLNSQKLIPESEFTTLQGETINIHSWKGHPVLVIFWATTCPSCIRAIPDLIKLYNDYEPKGLKMIAFSMHYDPPNRVVNAVGNYHIPYMVALDLDKSMATTFDKVRLTPAYFLLGNDSRIELKTMGSLDLPNLKSRIEKIMLHKQS